MRYVVLTVLVLWGCWNLAAAQSVEVDKRESLRGLPGVYVVVEDVSKDAQADGLSQDAIRSAAELVLRSHGIRVLSQHLFDAMPSAPLLGISISSRKDASDHFYIVVFKVVLSQRVSLPYTTKKEITAATWEAATFGNIGTARMREAKTFVEDLVKEFANDFRAVNPR